MVPKYKKNYGSLGIKSVLGKSFAPEVAEDPKKLFQVTNNNIIIAEKSKVIAKLHIEIGNITISTKNHLPNNISCHNGFCRASEPCLTFRLCVWRAAQKEKGPGEFSRPPTEDRSP